MIDNLGRLVAAERNALAAIELARQLSDRVAKAEAQLAQATRQAMLLQEQVTALQVRLALQRGTGATET